MGDSSDEVVAQIFSYETAWGKEDKSLLVSSPGYSDIKEMATLLASDCGEEQLQVFLENHPQFLLSLFGFGDDANLAFLVKPPISSLYKADFAVIEYGQGGCYIYLVEIERANASLFTNKGTPAKDLQNAMGQVSDWSQWISINKPTFSRDTISYAKSLPMYPERAKNNSFRLRPPEMIEEAWQGFGGYERPKVNYVIVIGRWAKLSENHRKRLIFLNSDENPNRIAQIRTYDQIARRAFERPYFGY